MGKDWYGCPFSGAGDRSDALVCEAHLQLGVAHGLARSHPYLSAREHRDNVHDSVPMRAWFAYISPSLCDPK